MCSGFPKPKEQRRIPWGSPGLLLDPAILTPAATSSNPGRHLPVLAFPFLWALGEEGLGTQRRDGHPSSSCRHSTMGISFPEWELSKRGPELHRVGPSRQMGQMDDSRKLHRVQNNLAFLGSWCVCVWGGVHCCPFSTGDIHSTLCTCYMSCT